LAVPPSDPQQSASDEPAQVIGAIPARYGSTRIPGKPLRSLAGKPLVEHVYRQAKKADALSRVVVLTDDERIAAAIDRFGGDCEMTPVDCVSGTDRIAWAAREWEEAAVVNIQGDEPMIDPEAINRMARHLMIFPDDEIVTLAAPAGPEEAGDPNVVKVAVAIDGRAMYFSRSVLPYPRDPRYSRPLKHIGIYGYQRQTLLRLAQLDPSPLERAESLEQLRALENGISIRVLTTSRAWLGVDTMEDLAKVEDLLSRLKVDEEDRSKATPA
jgi:3-deoxy-manno-octulosonate cytidylyltransferase (CMP-KDO synthetase)